MSDIVTMKDFKKLDIRIGTVAEVERVPGSRNLYKLQVDMGGEMRQIITGLVGYYTEEELKGKVIAVLTNLKPAKIFGQMSNGMLLAAEFEDKLALLTVDREIPNGAQVT
ncbi:methionine--tRNA ligase subunit beta [Candidatus Bathyarchaeota archaeon]|nr:MAG: methionine--tRNA ligase subunit beta [Candidatus Bathyarchaeota archaeon]